MYCSIPGIYFVFVDFGTKWAGISSWISGIIDGCVVFVVMFVGVE